MPVDEAVSDAESKGVDVIHLYGFPWWAPAPHIIDAACEASKLNIFPPADGLPEFKDAIASKLQKENKIEVDPEREVLVTNAANQALFITFQGLIDPGDEVILTRPSYYFHPFVSYFGGRPIFIPLHEERNFRINIEEVKNRITPKTKMIVLCNPENPVGIVYNIKELKSIADIAEQMIF